MDKRNGSQRVMRKTVNTDIFVLAIALFPNLNQTELWIRFGSGQNQVHLPVNIICDALGIQKFKGLLFFHALTGCDQPSFFTNC